MTAIREVTSQTPGIRRYVVASTADLPEGARILVEVDGREIGIFNIKGEFFALLNRCPHRAGPLCEGETIRLVVSSEVGKVELDDKVMLTCPWHGWEFDIRTGQSYWDPAKTRGRKFPVEIERGDRVAQELGEQFAQLAPGPYVADMIPTSVEETYVIVSLRQQVQREETDATP